MITAMASPWIVQGMLMLQDTLTLLTSPPKIRIKEVKLDMMSLPPSYQAVATRSSTQHTSAGVIGMKAKASPWIVRGMFMSRERLPLQTSLLKTRIKAVLVESLMPLLPS